MILYNSLFFYFIRYSSISAANVTDYGIEALCGPFLADVDLDVSVGIKDEELFGLQAGENLKTLRMSSCFENSVTFRSGLAPLLKVRGFELTTLKIDSLQNVDVALLIQLCPNLQHFLQNNAT